MRSVRAAARGALVVLVATTMPARAFTIDATFAPSISTDPNAAAIEASINSAIGVFDALITTNETVSIDFQYNNLGAGALGESTTSVDTISYSQYVSDLTANATSANDATALANLSSGNSSPNVDLSTANARAVGETGFNASPGVLVGGSFYDGIVALGTGNPFQFSTGPNRVIAPGSFDAMATIEHEIDEVLGLGSVLPRGTNLRPEDLFRYTAPGVASLSRSGSVSSYFSIDGGNTSIVGFNQNTPPQTGGDFGDWLSPSGCPQTPALVQYAFFCAGQKADVSAGSPEGIALDVIGYTIAAVPEPESLALFGLGLLGAAGWARRRRS